MSRRRAAIIVIIIKLAVEIVGKRLSLDRAKKRRDLKIKIVLFKRLL